MYEVFVTDEFRDRFRDLPKDIKKKFTKQLRFFRSNPFHPSLHVEKLHPKERAYWSFRIDQSYRVIFKFTEKQSVVLMNIGPHGWIYRF